MARGRRIPRPDRLKALLRPAVHRYRRARDRLLRRSGRFDGSAPLSSASGYDRGTPIDRFYIERFLAEHARDIHGCVLEVGDDTYSRRFGGGRITRQDVLHLDRGNPSATIVGDLGAPGLLPPNSFDCIIVTQTLQYVFDLQVAVEELRCAMRPGGTALVTVPAIAPISSDWQDSDYWRFTLPSVERLFAGSFGREKVSAYAYGNLYAATAFLHGAAVEEVAKAKLEPLMPAYAVIIAARAVRGQ